MAKESAAARHARYLRNRAHIRARYLRNRERVLARAKARREADPDAVRAYKRQWRLRNLERLREYDRERSRARGVTPRRPLDPAERAKRKQIYQRLWYEQHREAQIAAAKRWRCLNPGKARATRVAYNRTLQRQRCTCCTSKAFAEIYQRAHETGAEVDHILALALGGLHCISNLQLLSPEEHKRKTAADQKRIAQLRRIDLLRYL